MLSKNYILIPCCICDEIPERTIRDVPITAANILNDVETFRIYELACKCLFIYSFKSAQRAIAEWNFRQYLLYGKMGILSNAERYQFLIDLDESSLSITSWEVDFVKSILDSGNVNFSEKQQGVIDKMIAKYDNKIL